MAGIPKDFRYTKEHEWVQIEADDVVRVGVTEYATEKLGEIVYVELPDVDDSLDKEDTFGIVESTKAVSDLFAPVSGTITEVNDVLLDTPDLVNQDAYDEGWLIRMKVSDPAELEELMTAADYEKFIADLDED